MNALLQKIGVSLPIIQALMAGVSTPEMAAAVSNAGGLGSIGVGAADAESARKMITSIRSASNRPFNVNVFCHHPAVADAARPVLRTLRGRAAAPTAGDLSKLRPGRRDARHVP